MGQRCSMRHSGAQCNYTGTVQYKELHRHQSGHYAVSRNWQRSSRGLPRNAAEKLRQLQLSPCPCGRNGGERRLNGPCRGFRASAAFFRLPGGASAQSGRSQSGPRRSRGQIRSASSPEPHPGRRSTSCCQAFSVTCGHHCAKEAFSCALRELTAHCRPCGALSCPSPDRLTHRGSASSQAGNSGSCGLSRKGCPSRCS